MVAMTQQHPTSPLWTAYQLAPWDASREQLQATLASDVAAFGGKVDDVLIWKSWSYFPHVTTATLGDDFYQRVEDLQGRNATYYMGSVLSFETVSDTVDYALALVARFFGDER